MTKLEVFVASPIVDSLLFITAFKRGGSTPNINDDQNQGVKLPE